MENNNTQFYDTNLFQTQSMRGGRDGDEGTWGEGGEGRERDSDSLSALSVSVSERMHVCIICL